MTLLLLLSIVQDLNFKYSIDNYRSEDHPGSTQSWMVKSDSRNFIYIANNAGLLEYNAAHWKLHKIKNKYVFSLDIDEKNTVFVGGIGEFGYFREDEYGQKVYFSLSDSLKTKFSDINRILDIQIFKNKVYFLSRKYLFVYNYKKTIHIPGKGVFYRFLKMQNQLFVFKKNDGLYKVKKNSFEKVRSDIELSKAENRLISALDLSSNKSLLVSPVNGFYTYENQKIKKIRLRKEYFKFTPLFINNIDTNYIGISTRDNGFYIIDRNYNIKKHLNSKNGLTNSLNTHFMVDKFNNIWLTTNNSFSKFDYLNYTERIIFNQTITTMYKKNNTIYLGSQNGIYKSDKNISSFSKIEGISQFVKGITESRAGILYLTSEGLFCLTKKNIKKIHTGTNFNSIVKSQYDKNVFFITLFNAIVVIKEVDENDFVVLNTVKLKNEDFSITELAKKRILLKELGRNLFDLNFDKNYEIQKIKLIKTNNSAYLHKIVRTKEPLFHSSVNEISKYNLTTNRLEVDSSMNHLIKGLNTKSPYIYFPAKNNSFWAISLEDNEQSPLFLKNYRGMYLPYRTAISSIINMRVNDIINLENDQLLLSTDKNEIIKLDKPFTDEYHSFKVYLHNIEYYANGKWNIKTLDNEYIFEPEHNSIRIRFSAPFYKKQKSMLYQYKLGDNDNLWSNWSKNTEVTFFNLNSKRYLLKVRAKNDLKYISKPVSLPFKISKFWYQSSYVYFLYLILVIYSLFWLKKIWISTLRNKNEKLNKLIEKQTIELKNKNKELIELNEIRSNFYANISHEFKTPLTLIINPLDEISSENYIYNEAKHKKYFSVMKKNATSLLTYINQLLDISKLNDESFYIVKKNVFLQKVLNRVLLRFETDLIHKKIHIFRDIDNVVCLCDEEKIETVFNNLVSNAIKFSNPGSNVSLTLKKIRQTIVFSIDDEGIGIDDNHVNNVFDRFYSARASTVSSGIGLNHSKKIIELHGGKISLKSKKGIGTTVTVQIPNHTFSSETLVSDDNKDSKKGNLLILEDNTELANYLYQMFSENYNVTLKYNGEEALKYIYLTSPDLIIADIIMPGMDGYEFCKTLQEDIRCSHIPIIVITALSSDEDKLKSYQLGAEHFLTKPFSQKELMLKVSNLIRKQNELKSRLKNEIFNPKIESYSYEENFIKNIKEKIAENIGNQEFQPEQLAESLGMSRANLFRKFKSVLSTTPGEFLKEIRLVHAKQLIIESHGNVSEVAYASGFNNVSYFSKLFKQRFGTLPSNLKKV